MKNIIYLFVVAVIMAGCSKDKALEQEPTTNLGEVNLVVV